MTDISNKELISKTQDISKAFNRTTQDTYLADAMEKLSAVWSLKYGGIFYVSGVSMVPEC